MQKISITNIKPKERSILKRYKHQKQKDSLREQELKKKSRIPNPWRKILPSDMILAQGKEALDHPVPVFMKSTTDFLESICIYFYENLISYD